MSNTLKLEGLDELRAALRNLPAHLQEQAQGIVQDTVTSADTEIVAHYPQGPTGHLKAGVRASFSASRFGTVGLVQSRAKHAWMFEHGTQPRRTARGANRGRMPKADASAAMIPVVVRLRTRMVQRLIALVKGEGLEVQS